jgi:hypothetical protein
VLIAPALLARGYDDLGAALDMCDPGAVQHHGRVRPDWCAQCLCRASPGIKASTPLPPSYSIVIDQTLHDGGSDHTNHRDVLITSQTAATDASAIAAVEASLARVGWKMHDSFGSNPRYSDCLRMGTPTELFEVNVFFASGQDGQASAALGAAIKRTHTPLVALQLSVCP